MPASMPHWRIKNIESYSNWQKSSLKICICAIFVVPLHPILKPRMDLTACNLVKRMLKLVSHELKQSLVDFFYHQPKWYMVND